MHLQSNSDIPLLITYVIVTYAIRLSSIDSVRLGWERWVLNAEAEWVTISVFLCLHDSSQFQELLMLNVPFAQSICLSLGSLGLVSILVTVLCWAFAANVAFDLFTTGVKPLELAGSSAMIATFGLAILNSFLGSGLTRPMNLKQFALGVVLVFLVATDYIAIQQLPVAIAIVLLFTSPILVVLWTAFTNRRAPSRLVLVALLLSILGVVLVSKLLESSLGEVNWFGIGIGLTTAIFLLLTSF